MLSQRGLTPDDRAAAYSNRGVAYKAKGEYDQAIADYSHAIELTPKLAAVYYDRASPMIKRVSTTRPSPITAARSS